MFMKTLRRPAPAGFTLVELLATIAIIALLIGILVPAISAARNSAKKAATNATLHAISTGLESYKTDGKLGGQYPPSRSDAATTDDIGVRRVYNPYRTAENPPGDATQTIEISGAGLLVWALVGADLLGTPGFRAVKPTGEDDDNWAEWTGTNYTNSANPEADSGLYALYPSNHASRAGQPVHRRYGPYVALDKMRLSARKNANSAKFVFENDPTERDYAMFLDSFGNPILYWRADPAGKQLIDRGNSVGADPTKIGIGVDRGIYHWIDNGPLLQSVSGSSQAVLQTGEGGHKLGWQNPTAYSPTQLPQPGTFAAYILNQDAKAKLMPQRPDSFLLITAGRDGIYGTGDDVCNFDPAGN